MAQTSSIVINDGQATPVAHTFGRMPSTNPLLAFFKDTLANLVSAAKPTFSALYRPAARNNDGAKRTYTILVPDYDAVGKVVTSTGRIKIEVLTPEGFSLQGRKDLAAYGKNFLASTAFANAVQNDDEIV